LIHGILHNAQTSQPFHPGDMIHLVITNLQPLEASLTKEYVRPLLIFDMHGVLGEREPWEKRRKDGKRRFIKRPYCEEFIRFCSQHFELAVWSCGKKKNIDLNIFSGVKLLFVWCQDESTNLYPHSFLFSRFYSHLSHSVGTVAVISERTISSLENILSFRCDQHSAAGESYREVRGMCCVFLFLNN
jgi:hypothetical protein